MANQDEKVGKISTFLQQLDAIRGQRRNQILFFRGHSKMSFQITPTIYRNAGWIANEANMLKELILRCPNDFAGGLSTFQCLVKMQHYSLPTRLLDITSNPLVALYFACATHEKDDEHGEVIVFGFDIEQVKYFDSDTVSVISNLSRRPADFKVPAVEGTNEIEQIVAFNKTDEIKLLLHDVRQDKPHFESIIQRDHLGKVICVKPMLDNPRIVRQEGAFLLFGIDGDKAKTARLEDRSIIERITIRIDKKREIFNELEALGINKATLFPEIEQVAGYIRDNYQSPVLRWSDLTASKANVLKAIFDGPPQSILEIASKLGITASSTSLAIGKLLELKLVESFGSGRDVRWQARRNIKVVPE